MAHVYLICPACRGRFNADDGIPFTFCPFCSTRVVTKEVSEDEIRELFIRNSVRCNRQCERTGFKCRCGCVMDAFRN